MILAITALCAGGLLEVDRVAGPYFEVQDAIDAAASGDIIRVAAGDYQGFVIDSKSLMVVAADSNAPPHVLGTAEIVDLQASETVTLSGLICDDLQGTSIVTISDCAGSVRLQDMLVGINFGSRALNIIDCDDVSLHKCGLRNGGAWPSLTCRSSNLTLFSSRIRGGSSPRDWEGAAGLQLIDSSAIAMDCALIGGQGGPQFGGGLVTCLSFAMDGGPGVQIDGSVFEQLGGYAQGGPGGIGFWDCGGPGNPGPGFETRNGGLFLPLDGTAPTLNCPQWVQLGDTFVVDVRGEPADPALLLFGIDAGRTTLPGATGALLLGGPASRLRRLGISSSTATVPITVPLSPFFFGEAWRFQSAHVRNGALLFGPVRTVAVL